MSETSLVITMLEGLTASVASLTASVAHVDVRLARAEMKLGSLDEQVKRQNGNVADATRQIAAQRGVCEGIQSSARLSQARVEGALEVRARDKAKVTAAVRLLNHSLTRWGFSAILLGVGYRLAAWLI